MAPFVVPIDQEIGVDQGRRREVDVPLQDPRYQVVCHSQADTWEDR